MQPRVDFEAVFKFNKAAPALASIVIGGRTFEVFRDYWHMRPYPTQRYVVTGQLDVAYSVRIREVGTDKVCLGEWDAKELFKGKGAAKLRAEYLAWARAMERKYTGEPSRTSWGSVPV